MWLDFQNPSSWGKDFSEGFPRLVWDISRQGYGLGKLVYLCVYRGCSGRSFLGSQWFGQSMAALGQELVQRRLRLHE